MMKIDNDSPEKVKALHAALCDSYSLITRAQFVGQRVFGEDFREINEVIRKFLIPLASELKERETPNMNSLEDK